jgi:hypothetical protein
MRFDTSHNTCYLDAACGMRLPGPPPVQPFAYDGVIEYPVTFFRDCPGHFRHAQLCAISSREMRGALWQAHRKGWSSFVIVSHSFELIRDRKQANRHARPDRYVIRRFELLCKFLGAHRDTFPTSGFADLPHDAPPLPRSSTPLTSRLDLTALRFAEQLARRLS